MDCAGANGKWQDSYGNDADDSNVTWERDNEWNEETSNARSNKYKYTGMIIRYSSKGLHTYAGVTGTGIDNKLKAVCYKYGK